MQTLRGMSFMDVIVGIALMLIIFLALFGMMRASVELSSLIKMEATATAIANSQMEYARSLTYDQIGIVGGIPNGIIPEYATTTEDGFSYSVRTFVDYYDDPSDGTSGSDTNGIITDYKRIKVTVTYTANKQPRQITLVSVYAPVGIETTAGGGTLQVLVVNAVGSAVSGATVHFVNASTSPAVNFTTFSDANGSVFLPGAATSTDYQVTVTKAGYSTAQTYARDATNQNPTPGYLTVVKDQTTSATFAIDLLGTLILNSFSPIAPSSWSDSFADTSKLVSLTNTAVAGGELALTNGGSGYAASGSALSSSTAPAYLASWSSLNATTTIPVGTTLSVHVADASGSLLPDTVLPGNSTGFSSFPVDLSGVSTTTYPSLALLANMTSSATTTTPAISGWSITSEVGPIPLPNVSFTLTGAKTTGSTGAGAPIYKTTVSGSTGSAASDSMSLEWDTYSLAVSGHDVIDACNAPPYVLAPNATVSESLILGPSTSNSALITVTDSSGNHISGASVTLSRTGFTSTATTTACGNAYFGNLSSASDYTVSISDTGYTSNTFQNVSVSGETYYVASF